MEQDDNQRQHCQCHTEKNIKHEPHGQGWTAVNPDALRVPESNTKKSAATVEPVDGSKQGDDAIADAFQLAKTSSQS